MKKNSKKLTLKKETIYNLDDRDMNQVRGGATIFGLCGTPKPTPTPTPKFPDINCSEGPTPQPETNAARPCYA